MSIDNASAIPAALPDELVERLALLRGLGRASEIELRDFRFGSRTLLAAHGIVDGPTAPALTEYGWSVVAACAAERDVPRGDLAPVAARR